MEWYLLREDNDQAVPGVKETLDRTRADDCCSSPEYWMHWESMKTNRPEPSNTSSFATAKKLPEVKHERESQWSEFSSAVCFGYERNQHTDAVSQMLFTDEDGFNDNTQFGEDDSDVDYFSNEVSPEEFSVASFCREESGSLNEHRGFEDRTDDRLRYTDQSQDIFLDEMFESDLHDSRDMVELPYMSSSMEDSNSMQFENLSDFLIDSLSITKDPKEEYLPNSKTSEDWKDRENYDCDHPPSCSKQSILDSTGNVPIYEGSMHIELGPADEEMVHEGSEGSLEATVLQELETTMTRLNSKTRICFRDSLYRLARNSRQQRSGSISQNSDRPSNSQVFLHANNGLRDGKMATSESQTNAIDRTIADLLFNKMSNGTTQPLTTNYGGRYTYVAGQQFPTSKENQNLLDSMSSGEVYKETSISNFQGRYKSSSWESQAGSCPKNASSGTSSENACRE